MYEELITNLRNCAETNSLSLYKRELMKQASNAIEELSRDLNSAGQTIANLTIEKAVCGENRWIPVTERLPEKYHQVLVYGLNGMQIDYYAGEKSIGGRPLFMISEAKVTHWQPLPEPPKEET